jgi:hypothetical protein
MNGGRNCGRGGGSDFRKVALVGIHGCRVRGARVATVVLAFLAVPAVAGAASLSLSVDQPTVVLTPVRQVPTLTVTATGTADATASTNSVYIVQRDSTDPCAATVYDELMLPPLAGFQPPGELSNSNNSPSMGPFTTVAYTNGVLLEGYVSGYIRLCAYLYEQPLDFTGGAPDTLPGLLPAASATALVHVVIAGKGGSTPPGSVGSGGSGARCVVPHIVGKTLVQAKKLLGRAHCALGKVTAPKVRTGAKFVVRSSSPKAGARLPSGAKVNVKLRKG